MSTTKSTLGMDGMAIFNMAQRLLSEFDRNPGYLTCYTEPNKLGYSWGGGAVAKCARDFLPKFQNDRIKRILPENWDIAILDHNWLDEALIIRCDMEPA